VNITSPGYPHGYASNLNVTWILHTEPYYHIDIEIIDIDFYPIRSSLNMFHGDYLDVVTGIVIFLLPILFLFIIKLIIMGAFFMYLSS